MKRLYILLSIIGITALIAGCNTGNTNKVTETPTESPKTVINEKKTDDSTYESPYAFKNSSSTSSGKRDSSYTEEDLKSDPRAPSTNVDDYNSDGQYVPEDGISDNPEDYNSNGEYKPVEEMTQAEIEAELMEMLEGSLME